jgi:integrase
VSVKTKGSQIERKQVGCESIFAGREAELIEASREGRSPAIYPALMLALNAGVRSAEIRHMRWNQVNFKKQFLTVGKSKTEAGEGRTIPLNAVLFVALREHAECCVRSRGRQSGRRRAARAGLLTEERRCSGS